MESRPQEPKWNRYQKTVSDGPFFFVRSCIRQTFTPGAENMALKIMRKYLGLEVFEDPRHTCCTGIAYHSDLVPIETTMTIIARQLSLMQEMGYEHLLVSCITSFGLYNEVLEIWEHYPEKLEQTRQQLLDATGRTFEMPKSVVHTSDVIYKHRHRLAEQMKYKLRDKLTGEPLRLTDHVGCHYAKIFPDKGIGGAEFPQVLSGLAEPYGGVWVDYTERRHCCGFGFRNYILQENRGYSLTHTKVKLESMRPHNVELILTNCPGCNMFLDRWQYVLAEMEGQTYDLQGRGIPVMSHEEVTALLLGEDPWEIGLQMHQVQLEQLMDRIGVPYDAEAKYVGAKGEYLGRPDAPEVLLA